MRQFALVLAAVAAPASVSFATTVHNEAANGDLANNPAAPTPVGFALGVNTVIGSVTRSNDTATGDRDFLTFTIAPGQFLDGLYLTSWSSGSDLGFHAISAGATGIIPSGPGAGNVALYLGSFHIGPSVPTDNLLIPLGTTPLAGSGFSPPLGPGTYTYIIQQTGSVVSSYSLDFVVTPAPSAAAVLGVPALVMFRRRRH